MGIKSKKYKPITIWISFVAGLSIFIFVLAMALCLVTDENFYSDDLKDLFKMDIKETKEFQNSISYLFSALCDSSYSDVTYLPRLRAEGENIIYYAYNSKDEKLFTNITQHESIWNDGNISLPEGYDYYLCFDDGYFTGANDGEAFDVYEEDNAYWIKYRYGINRGSNYYYALKLEYIDAFIAVKENIVKNPYAVSVLYKLQKSHRLRQWMLAGIGIAFLLSVAGLVFSALNFKTKYPVDRKAADFMSHLRLEFKSLVILLLLLIPIIVYKKYLLYKALIVRSLPVAIAAFLLTWWVYLIITDMVHNKRGFLSNSYISLLARRYSSYEKGLSLQKTMLIRTSIFLAAEMVLFSLMFVIIPRIKTSKSSLLLLVFMLALVVYLSYWYIKRLVSIFRDVDSIISHMKTIRNGNFSEKLSLAPNADLYEMSELLNGIQEGMDKAVQKMMRSERMKIELVTNISHDLKTPLTSIISYLDLLSKEQGLTDVASDYVKILLQKSEQLKKLIQDLFDLSKASSGEMKVEKEKLDFAKLIQQTLADMEDEVSGSQLNFRLNLPQEPVYIFSDGKRLYRVLMNLFDNVLKYSMKGTRVYVDLNTAGNKAVLEIKNISNYEMNFSEEEILERFVRGDKSRTTEGSGLGLAIADSFMKLCGGTLNIKLDGDLFKAIVTLPAMSAE